MLKSGPSPLFSTKIWNWYSSPTITVVRSAIFEMFKFGSSTGAASITISSSTGSGIESGLSSKKSLPVIEATFVHIPAPSANITILSMLDSPACKSGIIHSPVAIS